MKKLLTFLENHFGILMTIGVALGLLVPQYGILLTDLVKPMLMFVLFLVFLKIDTKEILSHIQKPFLLIYLLTLILIVLPLVVYYSISPFNETLALGLLLLSATPPAVASPAFTSLVKGNTTISALLVVIGSLIFPFLMPLILSYTHGAELSFNSYEMFQSLATFVLLPLFIAQLSRHFASKTIKKTQHLFPAIITVLITLIVVAMIAGQSDRIITEYTTVFGYLIFIYAFFIFNHVIGYFMAFWLKKEDKMAISVTNTYMNNALTIVIAYTFFSPEIILITVLSEIPFATMLGPFRWFITQRK